MQDIPPIEVEFEQNDPVARLKTAFMLYIKGENVSVPYFAVVIIISN